MKDDFELIPYYRDTQNYNSVDYMDKNYAGGIGLKILSMKDALCRFSEPFIYADVDIVFLKSFYKTFLSLYNTSDILGHKISKGKHLNAGFMIITPNKKTRELYDEIDDLFHSQKEIIFHDEDFLNDKSLLEKHKITIGNIPNIVTGFRKDEQITKETLLCHVIGVRNSEDKIPIMKKVVEIGKKINGK